MTPNELDDPPADYERLFQTEYFHMTRLEAIFLALAANLEHRGKRQFYKAASLATQVERELERWQKLN